MVTRSHNVAPPAPNGLSVIYRTQIARKSTMNSSWPDSLCRQLDGRRERHRPRTAIPLRLLHSLQEVPPLEHLPSLPDLYQVTSLFCIGGSQATGRYGGSSSG